MKTAPNLLKNAIDLLHHLLQFNPNKRLTAENALKHRYIRRFYNPDEENIIGQDILNPIPDDIQLTVDEYRSRLYDIVARMKSERRLKLVEVKSSIPKNVEACTQETTKEMFEWQNAEQCFLSNQAKDYANSLEASRYKMVQYPHITLTDDLSSLQASGVDANYKIKSPKSDHNADKLHDPMFGGQRNFNASHKAGLSYQESQKVNNPKAQATFISSRYLPRHSSAPQARNHVIKPMAVNFSQQFNNPTILRTEVSTCNKKIKVKY